MRFRDLYDKMIDQEELGRRLALVNKALEQKPKQHQGGGKKKGNNSEYHPTEQEQTNIDSESIEHVWQRQDSYMEEHMQAFGEQDILDRLKQRSNNQLKLDS